MARQNPKRLDVVAMMSAGGVLLALAGVFLWRELQVPWEMLPVLASTVAAGAAIFGARRGKTLIPTVVLLAVGLAGGALYAITRSPLLLLPMLLTLVATVITTAVLHRRTRAPEDALQRVVLWYGMTASAIATSAALYFHFFTLGFAQDDLARRLVLTLGWLVTGVALVLWSRRRDEAVIRDSGFVFIALALLKAVAYDTTHLDGVLRIAGLAVGGLLLMAGAWVNSRGAARAA